MIVIPPKEQYMKSYTTINVQSYESGSKVYTEQFITIVIPKIAINSFKLDGASVNATLFNDFPNSYYSYANIPVTDGVHRSLADSAFGIYIYGYGIANSFGYTGGMSFKPIDYQAPQIMTTDSCYSVYGIVYDSLSSDSGIMSCQSPDSSKINVSVSINSISTNSKMTGFKASLIDKKFDGSFKINAIDSLNHISTKSIEIKGFTLGINNYELIDTTLKISAKLKTGSTKCFKIPIHNYGKFEQTISNFNFKNNINFVIDPPAPIIIKPGEIDTISICFYSNRDTNIAETFSFLNDCGDEKGLIEIKINTGSDIHSPGIIAKIDPCGLDYRVFASDTADWDSGIKNIKIVETINCKVNIVKQDGYSAELTIIRNSEDKDAIFQIMFTDSVGHNTLYADTIFSSSMNISSISMNSNNENEKNFGHFEIGVLTTDYIVLFNNGLNKLLINDVYLAKNTHFMIPQNQFPLIINPKDSIKLNIYFYPTAYDTIPYRDTLEINTGCLNQKILLKGYGDALIDTLNGKCNSNIVLKANSIYYGEVSSVVYPNPFSINAIVRIEVDSKQIIKLSIINSFGEKISELNNSELEKGIYEYIFKGNDLPNGIYFYKVETSSQQIIKPIILLR
jgi:hypothetical protein